MVMGAWLLLVVLHYPLRRLPYFWDEAGYYALAAADFYVEDRGIICFILLPAVVADSTQHLGAGAYAARGDLCRIRMASLRGLAFRGEDCDGSAGGGHGDRNL